MVPPRPTTLQDYIRAALYDLSRTLLLRQQGLAGDGSDNDGRQAAVLRSRVRRWWGRLAALPPAASR